MSEGKVTEEKRGRGEISRHQMTAETLGSIWGLTNVAVGTSVFGWKACCAC